MHENRGASQRLSTGRKLPWWGGLENSMSVAEAARSMEEMLGVQAEKALGTRKLE